MITYNYNGGNNKYASKDELVADFIKDANAKFGKTGTPVCMVDDSGNKLGFANLYSSIYGIFTDAEYSAKWAWLKEYILSCSTGGTLTSLQTGNESFWRYSLGAFLFNDVRVSWPASADYTNESLNNGFWDELAAANKNGYKEVIGTGITELSNEGVFLPGYTLEGWYDNSECTGEKITEVSGEITVYAKWILAD